MPQAIVMPEMGMYMDEGVLSAWLRPAGARVECGEPLLEITTEKVTFEVPSPAAGILHRVAEAGAALKVQTLLGYVLAEGESAPAESNTQISNRQDRDDNGRDLEAPPGPPRSGGMPKASPAARRLAVQHGIDLHLVKGSGPGGRIVEPDVLARLSQDWT